MAKLAFKLRNVPDDEAEDIRQLLLGSKIPFYETEAGNWGISMPGLWLEDDDDLARAKILIDEYQQKRALQARDNYQNLREKGQHRTVIDSIREKPLASIGLIVFCVAIIYFSTKPFVTL